MIRDRGILTFCWLLSIFLLAKLVPANKARQATVMFLYKQIVTWLFGTIVAEKGLIEYPVRIFKRAYKGSFSFEYFFYPTLCAIFNVYYPEKSIWPIKLFYSTISAGLKTFIEVLLEKHTNLIKYINWKWYWSFTTMALTNYSSRLFYRWMFKENQ